MSDSKIEMAVLADGKLLLTSENGSSESHTSRFASDAVARAERSRNLNDWKSETDSWGSQNMMVPGLPQFQAAARPQMPTQFTNLGAGPANTLCYSMDIFGAGGLFFYDLEQVAETRLMHANAFHPQGLASNPFDGMLAFGLRGPDGTTNLKTKTKDRPQQRQLTAGDTCDESPTWRRIDGRDYIYFHSTGIGRNQAGFAIGRGPGSICRIAIDEGDVETILEDPQYDFLQPKFDNDGNLHVIRRPYRSPQERHKPSFTTTLKDVIMLPYRMLRVLFFFANFMSMMFVGKPLTSDFVGATPETQAQQRIVWGQVLKTQKQIRKKGQEQRMRLVPDDWTLIRVDDHQETTTLAKHVMAFDVADDGRIVYSDGGGVYQVTGGTETRLSSTANVSQIAVIRT